LEFKRATAGHPYHFFSYLIPSTVKRIFLFHPRLVLQYRDPAVDAGAAVGRDLDNGAGRVDLLDVLAQFFQGKIFQGQEIGLGDQAKLRDLEGQRVLQGLVLALGDADQQHVEVGADVELGRADQVADVFHEQQLHAVAAQLVDGGLDPGRFQVAVAAERAGVDLVGLHAQFLQPFGVQGGLDVAFDDLYFFAQLPDRGLDQRGLARTRRAHQVDEEYVFLLEAFSDRGGDGIVGLEQLLHDINFFCFHGFFIPHPRR